MLSDIPVDNRKIIEQLKEDFTNSLLVPRIRCLIVHGSSLFQEDGDGNSDIDLELVLAYHIRVDIDLVKEIIIKNKVKAECQVRYVNEITDDRGLILRTGYKIFMYFAYSNGITLIGDNIYVNLIKRLTGKMVKRSLLISIQLHFKDIRKTYLGGAPAEIVNKNIERFLFDVCLYLGLIDYRKLGTKNVFEAEKRCCIEELLKRFGGCLGDNDIRTLKLFGRKKERGQFCAEMFEVINKIMSLI